MVSSYDVGSLPLRFEESIIKEGAKRSSTLLPFLKSSEEDASRVFEETVVGAFVDKLRTGLDLPNYPQFRDMNEMFFEMIRGVEKKSNGYITSRTPTAKPDSVIPEVNILKRNLSTITDLAGIDEARIKVCVTGPYTLSSFFREKTPKLFEDLGRSIANIASRSLFKKKLGKTVMLSIDEPVLGFLNDPLLDFGSDGRESLKKAWGLILREADFKGIETIMHLHNTSDNLFWEVECVDIIESHVNDPLYNLESTKRHLEETDKCLKASISITLFDNLIETYLLQRKWEGDILQKIGEIWTGIRKGCINPQVFLEEPSLLQKRLKKVVKRFEPERVPYAGPECGVKSFPTYEMAMECLSRVSKVIKGFE